jgi:hypothetical protein
LVKPQELLEEAVAAAAVEKAAHYAQLVAWYSAGCIGLRPVTPSSLLACEIGVRADLEQARRFLVELEENPDAELSDAGEPTIETHLEAPIIKPMEDGSKYINRGSPESEAPQSDGPGWPNPATHPDAAFWRFHQNQFWRSPVREKVEQTIAYGKSL